MVVHDEITGTTYHAVFVSDAAACCSNGIEYLLGDDTLNNEKNIYPALGANITVTGVVETYIEGEYMYVRLANTVLEAETGAPSA